MMTAAQKGKKKRPKLEHQTYQNPSQLTKQQQQRRRPKRVLKLVMDYWFVDLSINPLYFPNLQPKELNYFGQLVNADISQVIQYFLAYYYKHHGSRHWRKNDTRTRDREPILAWQTIHLALSQQEGFTSLKNDLENPSQGFLKFVELIESDMQLLSKRELSAQVTYQMRVYLLCSRFLLAVVLNLSMLPNKVRAKYIRTYNKWK
eukprot:scaffold51232_cov105-Cyclotella_meneghiniana.AAC.1